MPANFRRFKAGPDPFDRTWEVEFRWLQTGISIRHADTVDVKFVLWTEGEEKQEKVIALPHPQLPMGALEPGLRTRTFIYNTLIHDKSVEGLLPGGPTGGPLLREEGTRFYNDNVPAK